MIVSIHLLSPLPHIHTYKNIYPHSQQGISAFLKLPDYLGLQFDIQFYYTIHFSRMVFCPFAYVGDTVWRVANTLAALASMVRAPLGAALVAFWEALPDTELPWDVKRILLQVESRADIVRHLGTHRWLVPQDGGAYTYLCM